MGNGNKVTIKDVARATGLSVGTISRVLNRKGYYTQETLEKVEKAAQALGYRPNWMARGLRGLSSHLVGLIIPDLSNVFYTSLAESILEVLREQEYEMILCVTDEDPQKDLEYLQILESKNVSGILYCHPAKGSNSNYLRHLVESGMRVVEVNRYREKDLLDSVMADNFQALRQVVSYLVSLGHQRIALLTGGEATSTGTERIQGYRSALLEANLPFEPALLKIGSFSRSYAEKGMGELLALPDPPTAVIAGSNRITLGVLWTLNQAGLNIPDDISLVGIDDAEWLSAWSPPITVIDIAQEEMARLAVYLLLKERDPEELHLPVIYRLSTHLIIRKSCKNLTQAECG